MSSSASAANSRSEVTAVEIVLPKYACMRHHDVWRLHVCHEDLRVPWYGEDIRCGAPTERCMSAADSVFDRDYSSRPRVERNGYTFEHVDNTAIESALRRAIRLWFDHPYEFRRLIGNAMRADHSWNLPGQQYLNVYEHIRRDWYVPPVLEAAA